jgi:hypothetical protein
VLVRGILADEREAIVADVIFGSEAFIEKNRPILVKFAQALYNDL